MKNIFSTFFVFAVIIISNFANAQQITEKQKKSFNGDNVEEFINAFSKTSHNKCFDLKDESFSPLAFSARQNKTAIFNYLIESGVDVNLTCKGNTALMEAAKFDAPELVKILLQKGADKNVKDSRSFTAADYAKQYTRTEISELLK